MAAPEQSPDPDLIELFGSLATTRGPFVVIDLEATDLTPEFGEILEFAALLVEPSGAVASEFSMLVHVEQPVPAFLSENGGDLPPAGVPMILRKSGVEG